MADPHTESAWARAKRDAKATYHSWLFAIGGPVLGVLILAIGFVVDEHATSRSQGYHTALIIIFGLAAVTVPFLTVLVFQRRAAPYRQREEARTDLVKASHALDLERAAAANAREDQEKSRYRELRSALMQIEQEFGRLSGTVSHALEVPAHDWHGSEFASHFFLTASDKTQAIWQWEGLENLARTVTDVYRTVQELIAMANERRLDFRRAEMSMPPPHERSTHHAFEPSPEDSAKMVRLLHDLDTSLKAAQPLISATLDDINSRFSFRPPDGMSIGVRLPGP